MPEIIHLFSKKGCGLLALGNQRQRLLISVRYAKASLGLVVRTTEMAGIADSMSSVDAHWCTIRATSIGDGALLRSCAW